MKPRSALDAVYVGVIRACLRTIPFLVLVMMGSRMLTPDPLDQLTPPPEPTRITLEVVQENERNYVRHP